MDSFTNGRKHSNEVANQSSNAKELCPKMTDDLSNSIAGKYINRTDEEEQKECKFESILSSPSYYEELCAQLGVSVPTMANFLMYKIPWLISLHFAGSLGPSELAAVSLASTICNVTGMSLSVGLSSALSTLTGQARGDLISQGEKRQQEEREKNIILVAIGYSDTKNESKEYQSNELDPLVNIKRNLENGVVYDSIEVTNFNKMEKKSKVHKWNESPLARITTKIPQHFNFGRNLGQETGYNTDTEDDIPDPPLMPLTYLYRAIFIQMLFVFPIGIWWLHGVEPILLYLGQENSIANMAAVYLKILTPGLWFYSISFTLNTWLQSIGMAHVPAYGAMLGVLLHVPMNILFIRVLDFGYIGVGLATIVFQMIQPSLVCIYLFGTQKGRGQILDKIGAKGIGRKHLSFWTEAYVAASSFSGICQYLSLGVPGIIGISEWWASEVSIFFSGRLEPNPALALGAMAIYQSINSCCFMFSVGTSVAVTARVGTWLGKEDASRAALSAKIGLYCASFLTLVLSSIFIFTPHTFFPSFFTTDENVINAASRTIPFLAIYIFADGLQITFNGIIKGCGRQVLTIPIVIFAYWVVGLPLSYYFTFILHDGKSYDGSMGSGVVGLVGGMTIGTWVHFLLLAVTVIRSTDWEEEVLNAKKRISLEK